MKARQFFAVGLLLMSLAVNGLLVYERLGAQYYRKGVSDGIKQLGDRIIEQVQSKASIMVKMPDGQNVMLGTAEFLKQQAAKVQDPPVPPPVNTHPVIESKGGQR